MNKFQVFFCCLLFGYSSITQAQLSIGINAGYNKNYLTTGTAYRSFLKYEPLEGFNIGIPVKYELNNWFALQAEPQFIKKGYKLLRNDFYEGVYQSNTNNYIQLPLMGRFSFGGTKLKGFLNLGGYAAYWASGKVKGKYLDMFSDEVNNQTGINNNISDFQNNVEINESYSFDKRRDRRIDLGLVVGVGISYKINKKYDFFADTRYYRAMLDQQKNYMLQQVPKYNDTYTIQIGCFYNFGK